MPLQLVFLYLTVTLISLAISQNSTNSTRGLDPINNYCVRIDHQSTVKNGVLYIDGGIETYADGNNSGVPLGNIIYGYNTGLIAVNMSTSWNWKANVSEAFIPKTPNPRTASLPPLVSRGALYSGASSDPNIYLYGGTTSYVNTSFPGYKIPYTIQYTLWSFDTGLQIWDQYDIASASPQRPNSGASAEAPDLGLAFYLNGQIDNGSAPTTASLGGAVQFLEGMLVIQTTSQVAKNVSTDGISGSVPRTRGKMQYVEGVGRNGILVYLGGSSKSADRVDAVDVGDLVPMDSIDVYDIDSFFNDSTQAWYKQSATGDIPDPRIDHCLVGAWAPDRSSYNIYMYGGRGYGETYYDQIYVLSLPSFRWIKIFSGLSPRFGMTCHLVAHRQMLTVGGSVSTNLSQSCDWETKGVAIYDMTRLIWGSVFDAGAAPYHVPALVVDVVGGSENGSATLTGPAGGWVDGSLATLFNSSSSSTPSAPPPPPASTHALSKPAIAGIATAGVVALGLLIALARYPRRGHADAENPPPRPPAYGGSGEQRERAMLDARDTQKPAELMGCSEEKAVQQGQVTLWTVELGPPALVAEAP